jgi:glycosyl hydrolase family 106( putative alpha-L-rhamnosidase)
MYVHMTKYRYVLILLISSTLAPSSTLCAQQPLTVSRSEFQNPPTSARPMMRWWWFGPAVMRNELKRELDVMHAAGIGGVELAAEYPLALDDPGKGLVNLRYGSPEYIAMVRYAAEYAASLSMRVDLTLGSGWPYGGPEIPLELAAGRLKIVSVSLSSPLAAVPALADGDKFIAAFIARGTPERYDAENARRLPVSAMPSSLEQTANGSSQSAIELFFIASHTRQQVKRAAFGGEGYVLDHMAKPAIERHLQAVGDSLLAAFEEKPPYAIFSDSLEAYGSDWTPALPEEFIRRRGYDLISHLPELAQGQSLEADAVRHDWAQTLSELVGDNYLRPMANYAADHKTKFRSQTYGEPAVTLADESIPQLPEGEGPQWRAFSFTRWSSSANHVYGNQITSAETWTWLHSPVFRATPLDMKAEADRMFLQGVNQIIGHGYPYSAPGVAEPGWSLYAAAALNDHNPWWPVMPEITAYLARASWALRQGSPANDVELLLPEADAQAAFHPGHVSVTEEMAHRISPALMSSILDAGYNVDFIDLHAAQQRGLNAPVLVVPPTRRMPLVGVQILTTFVGRGGKLIFVGETPTLSPGLPDAGDSPAIRAGINTLLTKSVHIDNIAELPAALHHALLPDLVLCETAGKLGFLHRHLPNADLYFLANTTAEALKWQVNVRSKRTHAEWWDLDTGLATEAAPGDLVKFEPYGSRLLVLQDDPPSDAAPSIVKPSISTQHASVKLANWTASFPGSASSPSHPTEEHVTDTLWSDNPATRFYSGEVRYTSNFDMTSLRHGEGLTLVFGPGKQIPHTEISGKPGMRAWFEPPIREAAIVYINGRKAGTLWHPPYAMDVSKLVHSGENAIEIRVLNTAINALSSRPKRDDSALKAKYGDRFQMQDMEDIQPTSSGIAGPVTLEYTGGHRP